jgi:hypothetical protein
MSSSNDKGIQKNKPISSGSDFLFFFVVLKEDDPWRFRELEAGDCGHSFPSLSSS